MPELPSYTNPDGLGRPFSLYSHVAKAGDLVFAAGQVGVDQHNRVTAPDTEGQTLQAYENVRLILESQGASLRHVVRFVVYLVDAQDVPAFYAAREAGLGDDAWKWALQTLAVGTPSARALHRMLQERGVDA